MISLLLLVLGAGATAESTPQKPEREIAAAVRSLHDAGLHRDVAALERLYSPDYFHTNPDGSLMQRKEVLASYRAAPNMTFSSADASEPRLVVRDRFAIFSERLALHGKTRAGEPFVSSYRVTYALERMAAGWRFVNSHSSLLGIDKHPETR